MTHSAATRCRCPLRYSTVTDDDSPGTRRDAVCLSTPSDDVRDGALSVVRQPHVAP